MNNKDALFIKKNSYKVNGTIYETKTTIMEDGSIILEIITKNEVPVKLVLNTKSSTKVFDINTKEFALKLKK